MTPSQRAIAIGVAGVLSGFALLGLTLLLAGGGQVEVRLGDDEFNAGRTDALAAAIERDGPILFADASPSRARDIYVQHLGAAPDEGWVVFSAQVPGAERECVLEWDPGEAVFTDPCSDGVYPADGAGLPRFTTRVEDGRLFVDLRTPTR